MNITAVVPVWNGRELLARLLDSLDRQTARAAELLVIDNGSTDGAPEFAAARGARVIPMGSNRGFAAAVNRGIREARGTAIAVLNSDVELAPDYLDRLSAALSGGAWFATGKILSASNRGLIEGTFDVVCRGGVAWRAGNGCPDGTHFSVPQEIWSAPWTAALFRTDLFGHTGLLEEAFESYYEDVDFGLRCAALNLQGRYVPDALAWHHGSAALGRWHPETVRRIARNQCWLIARHYPPELRRRWRWPIFVAQNLWGLLALRHGCGRAWLQGKRQGRAALLSRRPLEFCTAGGKVPEILYRSNEKIIRRSPDFFWRMYFLLTRGEAK